MSLTAKISQYLGINAHANSLMQNEFGEWASFHHDHVTDITRALNKVLPEGYEARTERSLQIKEIRPGSENQQETTYRYPQPDSTAFDVQRKHPPTWQPPPIAEAELVLPVLETMDLQEDEPSASVIYKIEEGDKFGRPVTPIELLSPTNKPSINSEAGYQEPGYEQYRDKRNATLRSGLPLVEIDYLHQRPPIIRKIAGYPTPPHTHPFTTIVTNPRPSSSTATAHIHQRYVSSRIPVFVIT